MIFKGDIMHKAKCPCIVFEPEEKDWVYGKSACFERPFSKHFCCNLNILLFCSNFSVLYINNYIGMETIKHNTSKLRNSTWLKPLVQATGHFSVLAVFCDIFAPIKYENI